MTTMRSMLLATAAVMATTGVAYADQPYKEEEKNPAYISFILIKPRTNYVAH